MMSETHSDSSSRGGEPETMSRGALDEVSQIEVEMEARKSLLARYRRHARIVGSVVIAVAGGALIVSVFCPSVIAFFYGWEAAADFMPAVQMARALGLGTVVVGGGVFLALLLLLDRAQSDLDLMDSRRRVVTALGPREGIPAPAVVSYFDRLVRINVENLAEYYAMVKSHTNNSFRLSAAAGGIGFLLILLGLGFGFFGRGPGEQATAYVATAAGIITEFIAGVFFFLYNRTVRELKEYHDSLLAVQDILLCFKIVEDIHDEKERGQVLGQMLGYLHCWTRGA